jgi:hypothetical protein
MTENLVLWPQRVAAIDSMSDIALTEYLTRRADPVIDGNERYHHLAQTMLSDAKIFRDNMLELGAETDTAVNRHMTKPAGWFSVAEFATVKHSYWQIGGEYIYGGGKNGTRFGSENTPTRLVVRTTGELALVYFNRGLTYNPKISTDTEPMRPELFLDRSAGDSKRAARKVQSRWLQDLGRAAEHYMRKPFVSYLDLQARENRR